jgi:hypothetical protein
VHPALISRKPYFARGLRDFFFAFDGCAAVEGFLAASSRRNVGMQVPLSTRLAYSAGEI